MAGGVYDPQQWGLLREPKSYSMDNFFFVGNASFTLHLVRKHPSPGTGSSSVVAAEASGGQAGVRITSQLLDHDKVDHLVSTLSIEGAPPMQGDDKAKVARALAGLLNVVSSRVIVEQNAEAHDKRRQQLASSDVQRGPDGGHGWPSLGQIADDSVRPTAGLDLSQDRPRDAGGKLRAREDAILLKTSLDMAGAPTLPRASSDGQRESWRQAPAFVAGGAWQLRASQDVTIRIWCGSPADTDILAQQLQSLLKAGALTVSMQLAGLLGGASLKRLSVFRCGVELTCIDDEPSQSTPPPPPVLETTPVPPTPFPLLEVLLVSGTVVVPAILVSVGICICVLAMFIKRKRQAVVLRSQVSGPV